MLSSRHREHVANTMLRWFRMAESQELLGNRTQREVRDILLRILNTRATPGLRVANELVRWIFAGPSGLHGPGGGAGDVKELLWIEEIEGRRRVLRVIDRGLDRFDGEKDADLSNDLTALSYPMLYQKVHNAARDMLDFLKQQQRLEKHAAEAEQALVARMRDSVGQWEMASTF